MAEQHNAEFTTEINDDGTVNVGIRSLDPAHVHLFFVEIVADAIMTCIWQHMDAKGVL